MNVEPNSKVKPHKMVQAGKYEYLKFFGDFMKNIAYYSFLFVVFYMILYFLLCIGNDLLAMRVMDMRARQTRSDHTSNVSAEEDSAEVASDNDESEFKN